MTLSWALAPIERRSIAWFLPPLYPQRRAKRPLNGTDGRARRRNRRLLAALGVGFVALSLGSVQVIRAMMPVVARQKLEFVPGPDSSASCVVFPCAQMSVEGSVAQVSMELGIEGKEALQAATYYTDLLVVQNPSQVNVTLVSVAVTGVAAARSGDFGAVTVYYCPVQTNDPGAGCLSSYTVSTESGGTVFSGSSTIGPGSEAFIEFSGYFGVSAHPGDAISFDVQVTAQ